MVNKTGADFIKMLRAALPRLLIVCGIISAFTDVSHAGTFMAGVIILYAWKAFKYNNIEGTD